VQSLIEAVAMMRPDRFDTRRVVEAFHITLMDSLDLTPASMVLDEMGVKSAAALLTVMQGISGDAALAALSWTLRQHDLTDEAVLAAVETYLT
jgi:spore maturation protein SpmB